MPKNKSTSEKYLEKARELLRSEAEAIATLPDKVDQNFKEIVEVLFNTKGKVIVTGVGKSGHIGCKIAATFASTGTPSFFMHAYEAGHGDLGVISPDDTLDFCLSPVAGSFCGSGNLNHRVFSVIATDDTTLYVGTANGINKSTDGGISWTKFNAQNQNDPISGNFITALAYNKYNNILWASTWKAEDQNEFYGISSSSNGGQTWKTFLTDERTHNFGFKNFDVIVATDNGVFRSSDNGLNWILPNSIIDKESGASLKTKVFYDADSYGNNIWLGSADGLVKLIETPGQMWQGNWKIYFASSSLSSDEETYCYPNPFNPRQEELKIKYSTGGEQKDVTIQIFDFGFNYVRTVIQNASRRHDIEGPPDFWDGRDENGNYVPNGVYFYRVKTGDDTVYGKILVMQ